MWNMYFSVPTFILLIIIAAAFFGRRRLPVRLNAVFAGLLAADVLTMVLDYASTLMDGSGRTFPFWIMWLSNYLFFVFFLARSFYFFWFAFELLNEEKSKHAGKGFFILFAVFQVFLLIGSITGHIFSIRGGSYHSGVLYPFINIQFVVWIIAACVMTITQNQTLKSKKIGVYIYIGILFLGIIVRSLFPHLVIMNLFCLFAIQEIYLIYLNPDQYIDDVTSLFNSRGWHRVLDEAFSKKGFGMIGFGIRNFTEFQELHDVEQTVTAMSQIGRWIRCTWPKIQSFYLGGGIFILSSRRTFDQASILDEVKRRFDQPWNMENGEFYLSVNEMILDGDMPSENRALVRGMMKEAYHIMTSPNEEPLIHINEGLFRKQARKCEVHGILMDALSEDSLEMFLQPVVDAREEEAEGAEVLCRLSDGSGGYISPDEFINQAKNNGSMGVLGQQMFRKACRFMSREDVLQSRLKWINVNVAPEQFRNPNMLRDFTAILSEYELEPSSVHLEITEETMIDRRLLHDSMAKFRREGFIFAMDDFGSSYSNMIRLQQNHFSSVKIDREFTWSYFEDHTALLPDIVRTCHDLGMKVVAEGVETEEMAEEVKAIGCDYIQGYYYSEPVPAEVFIEEYIRR